MKHMFCSTELVIFKVYCVGIIWDIALLNLVINSGSLEISAAVWGSSRVHSFNWEESLTAIQLAEKAQHFWETICCRPCEWLRCPWYICFHFWGWSFMASPFHGILSCGHWMFKAVSDSLLFCLICGIRIATSTPCYFFVNQHFFGASFETSLNCNILPIMYTGSLRHYVKHFLVGFCPGIQSNCPFTGVTLLT